MSARHAGSGRIADTALIDQVRAAAAEMHAHLDEPLCSTLAELEAHRHWLNGWAGRAYWLLEQIGEMGE